LNDAIQNRLLNELASNLASAFEGMTGERPQISTEASSGEPHTSALLRREQFSGVPGAIWIAAAEPDWLAGGALVLEAAGITESDPEKHKAEFQEIVEQAVSGVARAMSQWLGREVQREQREETPPAAAAWSAIEVRQGKSRFHLLAAIEPELAAAFAQPEQALEVRDKPPAFDLLLDVELPLSVSFGRAEVPLKDVLKLTTGSIVELNREIGDQVEVIVNNCVIARGEVVTLDGNFGVRIQEVISRHERWKTLG
jgi:flagellar motor switch protein FliN/FliY